MPYRLNEHRAKIQFLTSARMPSLIYKACVRTGIPSNTAYIQHAVCEALARDLDIPLDDLLAELPPNRTSASHLFGENRRPMPRRVGPGNTLEEVK
jgi:hypothetical protein